MAGALADLPCSSIGLSSRQRDLTAAKEPKMASEQGRAREREAEAKRKRLAAALRENLKRRKAQQRGRIAAEGPQKALEAGSDLSDNHKF
jgi:hypothetical protein